MNAPLTLFCETKMMSRQLICFKCPVLLLCKGKFIHDTMSEYMFGACSLNGVSRIEHPLVKLEAYVLQRPFIRQYAECFYDCSF